MIGKVDRKTRTTNIPYDVVHNMYNVIFALEIFFVQTCPE